MMSTTKKGDAEMAAYLFVDTFAFEKLARQPECVVGQQGAHMTGYETYIIEQWACERKINRVVASYTGNSHHVVEVQVLYVPTDLEKWSQVTFSHFEELVRMHILPKATPLGNMLVTSLSSLPSNLSLINMSEQFRSSYAYFVVNENLRRLNVVGRTAVTAEIPSDSMTATFRRVFLTPPSVNLAYAVLEVGTLIQISLYYFGLLDPAMIDGLICDHTLKAIELWWSMFGCQRYRVSIPRHQDKLYMRMSCAALVGTVTGARQRLSALGLKPPKDPFDAECFVETVRRFQKLTKIPKTSFLDDQTYFKLIHETAKSGAIGSGGGMLTAMKSTVKEGFSGKASEAVDDWETLNLEQLVPNVRGNRAKLLWQGKGSECVPHLLSSLPLCQRGARTMIPTLSLSFDDYHHREKHNHTQHPPAKEDNIQKSAQIASSGSGGSGSASTATPGANAPPAINYYDNSEFSDHEPESHPLASAEHPPDSHTSLVHRFRKRKAPLGDAFDEKKPHSTAASGPPGASSSVYAHLRSQSASSDTWFGKQGQYPSLFLSPPSNDAKVSENEDLDGASDVEPSPQEETTLTDNMACCDRDHQKLQSPLRLQPNNLLTHDDQYLERLHPPDSLEDLRRTASLSEIEPNLFSWEKFASTPRILSMYEQAQELQREARNRVKQHEFLNQQVENEIQRTEPALVEAQRDNVLIKYHINASVKKEDAVRRRVKELEAFMARLDYELATLSVKLRDVDQSVLAFAAKVENADTKWSALKNVKIRPWWMRMLCWN